MFTCSCGGHMLSILIGSTSLGFPNLGYSELHTQGNGVSPGVS